ncbi:MAG: SDR family oxidoreductase, partial [Candidatus Omnitrophica bacterium]|nr:SDR family oxidoreductase [Candidatus Omnitrophota bacterium]
DFTNDSSVSAFLGQLETLPKIDVCVNNAGINNLDFVEDSKEKDWDDILAVNLKGPYLLTRLLARKMKKNRYGRIINISSIMSIVSRPKRSIYSTTKAGIAGFTKAVSNELAGHRILVNAVSPGIIITDLTRKNLTDKERQDLARQIPAGRLGVPSEISSVVLFLASKLNTYLTGKNIVVDGGFIDI